MQTSQQKWINKIKEEELEEDENLEQKNDGVCFTYAGFMQPGYHHFLIYCPVTQRVFCKDLIVPINTHYFYPEYPKMKEAVL